MEHLPVKAVLFDLDDTLWPIVPVIERAENLMHAWLQQHAPAVAVRFSIEQLRERRKVLMATDPIYQLDLRELRRTGLREAFSACGEDSSLADAALEVFSRARNEVIPFPDVQPALQALHGRVLLGSVSNGVADLETIGLARFFHTSIAAHRFGSAKPDPAIFLAACEAIGVTAQEAVYVGDDLRLDVEGAQRAGLRGVWLSRRDNAAEVPDGFRPDAVFGSLTQLVAWLEIER